MNKQMRESVKFRLLRILTPYMVFLSLHLYFHNKKQTCINKNTFLSLFCYQSRKSYCRKH